MTFGRILLTLITVIYCTLFTNGGIQNKWSQQKSNPETFVSTLLYKLNKGYSTRWSYRRNWKTCRIFLNTVHTNKRKNCIFTVFDPNTKHILLTRGIEIRNRYIKFVDVEKQVTNITMKDAPCELSNQVICAFMQKIGEVVQGSLRRGMIKGTNIETRARYMQLTNYVSLFPIMRKVGRFDVRIFADNNRTECQYCSQTDHPSYVTSGSMDA